MYCVLKSSGSRIILWSLNFDTDLFSSRITRMPCCMLYTISIYSIYVVVYYNLNLYMNTNINVYNYTMNMNYAHVPVYAAVT